MYVITLVVSFIGILGALFGLFAISLVDRKTGMEQTTFRMFGTILALGLVGNMLAAAYSINALTT